VVYVADAAANVVKLYDPSGSPLQTLGGFHAPVAVALSHDAVYVLDAPLTAAGGGGAETTGSRLTVLNKAGAPLQSFADLQMARPTGIAVDAFGHIFVSDASRRAVLVYSSEGALIGTMASAEGDLNTPVSVVLSRDGRLYVSSSETHSIVEVGLAGEVKAGSQADVEFKSGSGDRITPVALGY
jgi:DNA-binding beta-propeller fold protein YncE